MVWLFLPAPFTLMDFKYFSLNSFFNTGQWTNCICHLRLTGIYPFGLVSNQDLILDFKWRSDWLLYRYNIGLWLVLLVILSPYLGDSIHGLLVFSFGLMVGIIYCGEDDNVQDEIYGA